MTLEHQLNKPCIIDNDCSGQRLGKRPNHMQMIYLNFNTLFYISQKKCTQSPSHAKSRWMAQARHTPPPSMSKISVTVTVNGLLNISQIYHTLFFKSISTIS